MEWQEIQNFTDEVQRSSSSRNTSSSAAENTANPSLLEKAKKDRSISRRSQRVNVEIPIRVCAFFDRDRLPVFVSGKTIVVNAHGALLDVSMSLEAGQTVRLVNVRTKREIKCHVLCIAKRYAEGGGHIGVEFVCVSRYFWDISSPPADWDPDWVPPAHRERTIS